MALTRKLLRRPRIGITKPDGRYGLMWRANRLAIRLVGGKPVRITPRHPVDITQLDGLLLSGGDDLHPPLYGGEEEAMRTYAHDRDRLEMQLCRDALAHNMPILGICRGAQLLNVVLGGTLHADIKTVFEDVLVTDTLWAKIVARKPIVLEKTSLLYRALKRQELWVNSMHHQSVDRLGDGLVVSAREHNGIIQGVEMPDRLFTVGVQWHPEFLTYNMRHRLLFRAFVRAARDWHAASDA